MIGKLIAVALILVYLRIGQCLFRAAVNSFGGKEAYLAEIDLNHHWKEVTYILAFLMVVFFWPVFLIRGLFWNR